MTRYARFFIVLGVFMAGFAAWADAVKPPVCYEVASPVGAHRGGRHLWPENTALAFSEAAKRWPNAILETDVQATADGYPIMMHDYKVDRTTNGAGLVSDLTLAEIKALDAGYNFTPDEGKTFPYRGKGITVPTLEEALAAAPNSNFLIEMKPGPHVVEVAIPALQRANALNRAVMASFVPGAMDQARAIEPTLLTCFDFASGMKMIETLRKGDWTTYQPKDVMLALDEGIIQRFALTKDEIAKIRSKGIRIEVHTINTEAKMNQMLDLGVDFLLTDCPDILEKVAADRAAKSASTASAGTPSR